MFAKTASLKRANVSFETNIVRLYRLQKSKPQSLLAIVEEVGGMKKIIKERKWQ
jgi:hypothetical protein